MVRQSQHHDQIDCKRPFDKYQPKDTVHRNVMNDSLSETMSLSKEIFNFFDYKEFDNIIKIDEGEFGTIYKADWKDGGFLVALKVLKLIRIARSFEK
ncbi:5963_t:CDS:2 [Gigaspora margarita]|uniref:5963_t:CDS:1 n=1 Tax=Gigaspora margarita TaxID=4874 RepID=A0ABM8VYE6_GIGMA|nr:5963_t:CDS:2 [Gigaspora margarita]